MIYDCLVAHCAAIGLGPPRLLRGKPWDFFLFGGKASEDEPAGLVVETVKSGETKGAKRRRKTHKSHEKGLSLPLHNNV